MKQPWGLGAKVLGCRASNKTETEFFSTHISLWSLCKHSTNKQNRNLPQTVMLVTKAPSFGFPPRTNPRVTNYRRRRFRGLGLQGFRGLRFLIESSGFRVEKGL